MSIVVPALEIDLQLEFADLTVVNLSVNRPLIVDPLAAELWRLVLDVPGLEAQFGTLERIVYTGALAAPTVIPLPSAALLLVSAVAWVALRMRPWSREDGAS